MKLKDIPVAQTTLPTIDYKTAKQAQYWLHRQHGYVASIWRIGDDEWVLECDECPMARFMMVRVVRKHTIYEGLEIDPIP